MNAYLNAIERFNPNEGSDVHRWIPAGLVYDLIDTRNDFAFEGQVLDNVSGFTVQQCFNALESGVVTIPSYRNQLLFQNNGNQLLDVNQLFLRYGY